MENYDLFGDDLGSGMLDGLADLGATNSNFNNSSNQSSGTGNMMQSYNNQQPQYTQIGQGMAPPSKMPPGSYPDYSNQYGQYNSAAPQQQPQQPGVGGYAGSTPAPTRPMAGYPYPHQSTASPSMHYQDYSVQNTAGMMRPAAPTQPHAAPPPRMVTPTPQQQFGAYRPPSQESMYLQQFPRWNEQQTASPYGAASLPHHYPSNATSGYRAPAPPPHAYPSNLPRPPQSIPQQAPTPQQPAQSTQQPPPPSVAPSVSSQQHNIPYMARPQTPSVMSQSSQPQYGQSMYPNASNQYPNYHHASGSVGQLTSGPTPSSGPSYSHHTQQQYSLSTPSQQHQYGNQYGQYYPGNVAQPMNSQPAVPPPTASSMAYGGSYPSSVPNVNSSIPNGSPTYRPGYVQLPQLSPRQPTPSPRQPAPSPRPPSSTTPTNSTSSVQPTISQSQQHQPQVQQGMTQSSQPPTPSPQQQLPPQSQQPSSLQQLEQMVMPHVNKNSPSPKPPLTNMSSGVLSPMSGPKTPMSPSMSGPKTPMSPSQWQSPASRPPVPPVASKPTYLHPPQQHQVPNSPSNYGISNSVSSSMSNVENTINSVVRSAHESADLELSGLNPTLDPSAPDTSLANTTTKEDSKPSNPIPPVSHQSLSNELRNLGPLGDECVPGSSAANTELSINNDSQSHSLNASSAQVEEQRFSMPSTSQTESPMDEEKSGAFSSLSSAVENSHSAAMSQYTSSPSTETNPISTANSVHSVSPSSSLTAMASSSSNSSQHQQQDSMTTLYSNSSSASSSVNTALMNGTQNETTPQPPQIGGMQAQGPSPSMQESNMGNIMGNYAPGPHNQQQGQPYSNSLGSPQSGLKPMMPPPPSPHQYAPPRFSNSDPSSQQSYMNNYHNSGMYPAAPYGQAGLTGPLRPPGPPQYPLNSMGPQGMPGAQIPGGSNVERYNYEIHQLQQQIQHLYTVPSNQQTQLQISELQERLRGMQQQVQAMSGNQYSMQPPIGGLSSPPGYGHLSHGPGVPMDIPMEIPEDGPSKTKKKKERKPRENKGKGKKGKAAKGISDDQVDSIMQSPPLPHEVYDFQDVPPEVPEKKQKKPRKPREQKSPKEKKVKEPKTPRDKTPKRSRKKKPVENSIQENLNESFPVGDPIDGEVGLPKIEENSESDQKNGIGAAGITAAEGGSSAPISGGEGDTSTQDIVVADETAPVVNTELATPEKPKKPKKPKLKSSSTGKKRPSKTLLAFKNRKKRRRSDSEGSDPDRTPPPSPPPEDDNSNKRRSGRNTKRKKYIDDIDLALSDEDLLIPNNAHQKAIEASVASAAAQAAANAATESSTTPVADGQQETTTDSTSLPAAPTPTPTPVTPVVAKEEPQNLNKHNFFYVNTLEEDTMIVQHILSVRMGKREVVQDSSDEEDEIADKVEEKSKTDKPESEEQTTPGDGESKAENPISESTQKLNSETDRSKDDVIVKQQETASIVIKSSDENDKPDSIEAIAATEIQSSLETEKTEIIDEKSEGVKTEKVTPTAESELSKGAVEVSIETEKVESIIEADKEEDEKTKATAISEGFKEAISTTDVEKTQSTNEVKKDSLTIEVKKPDETKVFETSEAKEANSLDQSENVDALKINNIKNNEIANEQDEPSLKELSNLISAAAEDNGVIENSSIPNSDSKRNMEPTTLDTAEKENTEKSTDESFEQSKNAEKNSTEVENAEKENESTEIGKTDDVTIDIKVEELKSRKKKREPQMIEVEEFYVKYKSFSYLHCEWKTEEELMKGDKRVNAKIKRFKQKMSNNANIFEFIEEEPFNPDYVEVDRVLDMSEVTDPTTGKVIRNFLVKWRSLPYDEATWELQEDIDPEKLAHFHKFYKCPKKDQWKPKKRPKATEWVKLDESLGYKNGNTLREYQLEGLNWLSFSWFNGRNCILADEMGLGKTIQSLTFVESVHRYGIRGPFLVIAPLSTVPNWQREFETWTDLNVVVYHGSVASRNMIQEYELFYRHPDNPQMNLKDCYKFNVLITTFEIVLTDVMELKDFPWRVCVIDEAHRLKNKNCKLLEGLRLLNLEHRVLLSGTPLQNNVQELFSLLNFLEPSQFSSDEHFIKEFGELKTDTQVQKLQALLKPMMLRRLKEDVEKSIAPKEETIVEVELTNMQKKYYRAILERNFSFLSKGTSSANIPNLMNTMMELRKCCIHPYLLNGAEEQIQLDYRINYSLPESDPDLYYKALVHSSGKMVLVDKLLPKLKSSGHRVLIFSQMVRCLDILEDYLIFRKYPYERLDGRIRGPVRQAAIDRFSRPESDRFVFLLCTKAGGLGINLTAADTVIIYDSDWNPQNDLQAQARCHRIGQSKKVKIYRLICRNTYEREMFDRASLKLGLDKAVLQSMNTTQGGKIDPNAAASKQLTKKEVEDLLKRGAYGALMDEDNAAEKFCEEDIDFILERRTQIITLESGEKGSTFSKASFAATGIREDINIDDPDFWKKWAKKAELEVNEGGEKNELVIHEPRRRTQIKRYGHDEGVMDISDLDSSSDSDEEGNVGDRTRSGRAGRKTRSGKSGKRGRRGNMDDDFECDDGVVEYGRWSKSECYKIERGLLTYGWKRWTKILEQGQFRKGWTEQHMEDCARLILLHCVNNFRGDEKVKTFVVDLICPLENAAITRNHSGLANPVSRGGRKSKKEKKILKSDNIIENEDWMKEERFETEVHLDPTYTRHLSKNANKVLLRMRMLYYIKQEIIGIFAQKIDEESPAHDLPICPPGLVVDGGPVGWWDREADSSLLIGTYKHGYERYNIMRQDTALCFLSRCGPPDGSAVLAEISAEVNEEELEKAAGGDEEDDESNMEAKESGEEKQTTIDEKEEANKDDKEQSSEKQIQKRDDKEKNSTNLEKIESSNTGEKDSIDTEEKDHAQTEEKETAKGEKTYVDGAEENNSPQAEEKVGVQAEEKVGVQAEEKNGDQTEGKESVTTEETDTNIKTDKNDAGTANEKSSVSIEENEVVGTEEIEPAVVSSSDDVQQPTSTTHTSKEETIEFIEGKLVWPSTTDLNTRIRKLITAFQRYFKKEEIRSAQKAKRLERKEKIDQIVRERERQKMEVHQKRWSKKEESDFYRTVSTFGVQRISGNKYDWTKFRAISRLDKKFDETLTEYYRAFYAMCKLNCGLKLSEEEDFDLIQVPVDPLPEDRARRTLDRIDLLNKVREEIIHDEKLDERLRLCLPSLDMPEWWIPGKHDKDLVLGAARHGLGRTDLFYLSDQDLSFREILRRHIAGEPLLDPAEKLAYRNADKKFKCETEPPPLKRIRPDMVDIEIQDIKAEIERAKKKKAEQTAAAEKEKKHANDLVSENGSHDISDKCADSKDSNVSNSNALNIGDGDKLTKLVKSENCIDDDTKVEEKLLESNEVPEKVSTDKVFVKKEPVEAEAMEIDEQPHEEQKDSNSSTTNKESASSDKANRSEGESTNVKDCENKKDSKDNQREEVKTPNKDGKKPKISPEKEEIRNEEDESKGSSTEMNEVQVEIKNELKITIKLPAEKMNRVEVQVKGSPKFSVPEPPPPTNTQPSQEKDDSPNTSSAKPTIPKFDPFLSSDSNNIEALGNLLNQMNPIRWPRDRAIQIRLEHIVHAVEKNEWPVSRFFSSAAMTETFDYTPQGTPDAATPVRDTPTPISECSDLAPPEDLIMTLPTSTTTVTTVVTATTPTPTVTTTTPTVGTGRRGRRRRIAIDVETERAKLQALLNQSMHSANVLPHINTPSPRLNSSLRRERTLTPTIGLNLSQDNSTTETEAESRVQMAPSVQKQNSKFQPPPPAHQNHPLPNQTSLLRSSHQHQQRRSQSPAHRASPGFNSHNQSQSSSLDLSIKSTQKDVAAAAMSALSSLSSVTVTPVTLPSPSAKHSNRESAGSGLTISSAPMDLSGGFSKRHRDSSSASEKQQLPQEAPLNFGVGGTKKVSKLENMLDRLKKRKMGEVGDSNEPLPLEKDKKKKKLDEIVFGLSAAKGSNMFSPPMPSEKPRHQSHSSNTTNSSHFPPPHQSSSGRNAASPQISSHSGARSGTPSPQVSASSAAAHQSAKDAQAFAQNFLSNPLLSALSMFNAKDLKDFSRFASAGGANMSSNKKESPRTSSGNTPSPGASQQLEMPKCDLGRLAEIAVPKYDLFSHDAKVNKWLAEHANMTPERPPSPEFVDRRRRRPRTDPLMLDWNKLSGEEPVPVVHRSSGKKITGPKAPQLKHLTQWLSENQNYDVDPRWAELVKERGNLPNDSQKRFSGEKKKGPGRPPTLTSPPPNQASNNSPSVPTSSANNAFSNLGAFSSLPGLSGINPNLLASFGALDPKNPLFMPFGGLGSLGNLSSLGNLANLGSLSGMGNLGLPNSLFGLGFPSMGFGSDMPGMSGGGTEGKSGNTKETAHSMSTPTRSNQSSTKKEEKNKKSANAAAAAAAASQNLISSSLPFLFPNPGLMYNPLGLGSFPLGSGMSGSPFGNLGQGSLMNGLTSESPGNTGSKKVSSSGNKSTNSNNSLAAAGLGLNIPSLSKKELKELVALSTQSQSHSSRSERNRGGSHSIQDLPQIIPVVPTVSQSQPTQAEDSDDESLKSLMGNHQDELPDDDPPSENAERIVLKESKELEKEMAQQKMETRREKRERLREREDTSRGGLTSAERQLLMERKKERLAKEEVPRESGRTTRRSAAAASRSRLEDAVNKMRGAGGNESQGSRADKD